MRLYEFNDKQLLNDKAVNDVLAQNCSNIVESGLKLFRGMESKKGHSFIADIRINRIPRDSNKTYVILFDTLMEILGLPFRKSNTLSTTISRIQAQTYAEHRRLDNIFQIYPFDGCSYLYSSSIHDFYDISLHIEDQWMFYWDKKEQLGKSYEPFIPSEPLTDKTNSEIIKDFITRNLKHFKDKFQLDMTNNPKFIETAKGEILVYGSKYLAIQFE